MVAPGKFGLKFAARPELALADRLQLVTIADRAVLNNVMPTSLIPLTGRQLTRYWHTHT